MRYNQLGRTGLFVSEVCLGTMTFGGTESDGFWGVLGALQQDEVDDLVGRALAQGVNFFDTADIYAYGRSETLLGQALKNLGVARKTSCWERKSRARWGWGRTIAARAEGTSWTRSR